MTLGTRRWSSRPTGPSSRNRFLNFSPVFLEIPYSRHKSVSFSPSPSRTNISVLKSTGLLAFQGTEPSCPCLISCHPCAGLLRHPCARSAPSQGADPIFVFPLVLGGLAPRRFLPRSAPCAGKFNRPGITPRLLRRSLQIKQSGAVPLPILPFSYSALGGLGDFAVHLPSRAPTPRAKTAASSTRSANKQSGAEAFRAFFSYAALRGLGVSAVSLPCSLSG